MSLNVVDLYGNDANSPALTIEIRSATPAPAPPPVAPPAPKPTAPALKSYKLENIPEGLRVNVSSLILFDVNKYDLKASAQEGLDQVIDLLRAYPTNSLRISGHTDSTGSAELNQRLSENRARAVSDYLIHKGNIALARIKVVGFGKRRPIASNVTEVGRQQNRRVEIDILK